MKDLAIINRQSIPKEIYAFCRSVSNRYGKAADETMVAEVESIKILTANINPSILQVMCSEAVKHYPADKSKNKYLQFDINYIMTFYQSAEWLIRNKAQNWEEWAERNDINNFSEIEI